MDELLRLLQELAQRKLRKLQQRGQDPFACEQLSQGIYLTDVVLVECQRDNVDSNWIRRKVMDVLHHYLLGKLFEDDTDKNPRSRGDTKGRP